MTLLAFSFVFTEWQKGFVCACALFLVLTMFRETRCGKKS